MNLLNRSRPLREPPILLQILVLLLGGLVVAQLVTLLLTLVLPPAPPTERSLDDVIAALRGTGPGGLVRTVRTAPPAVEGPGWFTSPPSRHALAERLGVADDAVRLAFYAPLPFAGITAPPSRPPEPLRAGPPDIDAPAPDALHPIAWRVAPEPLRSRAASFRPIALIVGDAGGPPGGGGGFQGGGFPGGGGGDGGRRSGQGGFPGGSGGAYGNRGGGDMIRQDRGIRGGNASPGDLDRQPMAQPDHGMVVDRGVPFQDGSVRSRGDDSVAGDRPVPTEGFDPRSFQAQPEPVAPVQAPPVAEDRAIAPVAPERHAATTQPDTVASVPAPAVVSPSHAAPVRRFAESAPVPVVARTRGLFGLAPAPFVEGDFVAALHRADGRWVIVQPEPAAFPNAWQRRVMLWFAIAFALVAPIGWLFARHIVRPLARFTEAAEQLGRDPSAALVALDGPAEIGRAAHAFNVMQNRLRSFVDDRTAMVGAISHDLRTPLTRMRFRIEEVDDEAVREGMSEEVAEMEAMITSVLAFIRDASTPNIRERLDLGLLVDDVVQDAALIGSDVSVESMAAAPVEVDVLGMRRLLANLVENAVKYGGRARIRLAVDDDAAVAEILDDGPGVPAAELERAFEPFYRASNAEGSGKSGSGLGLAVCRSIARAHGGDVLLVHADDGFRAQLRLPLAYGADRIAA